MIVQTRSHFFPPQSPVTISCTLQRHYELDLQPPAEQAQPLAVSLGSPALLLARQDLVSRVAGTASYLLRNLGLLDSRILEHEKAALSVKQNTLVRGVAYNARTETLYLAQRKQLHVVGRQGKESMQIRGEFLGLKVSQFYPEILALSTNEGVFVYEMKGRQFREKMKFPPGRVFFLESGVLSVAHCAFMSRTLEICQLFGESRSIGLSGPAVDLAYCEQTGCVAVAGHFNVDILTPEGNRHSFSLQVAHMTWLDGALFCNCRTQISVLRRLSTGEFKHQLFPYKNCENTSSLDLMPGTLLHTVSQKHILAVNFQVERAQVRALGGGVKDVRLTQGGQRQVWTCEQGDSLVMVTVSSTAQRCDVEVNVLQVR